ncbi:MAG: permease [bacterium]|nr:permease [bacterium]
MKAFLDTFLHIWVDMFPWLIFGFVAAFLCSLFLSERWMRKHLGGKGWTPIVKASLFGLPLPICSCGVLLVALALRENGARKAPVCAFIASTPQSGSDTVLLSVPILGPVLTGLRFVGAILSGLLAGALVRWFGVAQPPQHESKDLTTECASVCACHHHDAHHPHQHGESRHHEFAPWSERLRDAARYAFYHLPKEILLLLIMGTVIAAAIECFMPHDVFAGLPLVVTYLAAILIGLPTYACSVAMIPIAAELIFHCGVTPGAAFIFLACAPTIHVGSMLVLWKKFGLRTVALLIAGILIVSVSMALLIDGPLKRWINLPSLDSTEAQSAIEAVEHHHHCHGCCSHSHESFKHNSNTHL